MRDGFSLVEILLAVLVLALACVPVLMLFPSGARRTAFGDAQLRAHLRAEALLSQSVDMAIRTGFRNLPIGQGVPVTGGAAGSEAVRFEGVPGYPGLWKVTSQVEWRLPTDPPDLSHTCTVRSLVHKPELGLTGDWALR
ncbi:MAG: prepilin-type N-terminal cleavage/methylation domain-containing protein [Candidatus Riflebacteria bacterium]|nr:prepilin-type N-terminal cleavage/methylation domain-containing protein [Candidatus Riflebacteria bacterium]